MDLGEFAEKIGAESYGWDKTALLTTSESDLPCFSSRYTVVHRINSPILIKQYIKVASEHCDNDVLVFSVTEQDGCWQVWKDFAIAHPKTFQVVQGGSGHANYQCRMYIYTKPKSKRRHGI